MAREVRPLTGLLAGVAAGLVASAALAAFQAHAAKLLDEEADAEPPAAGAGHYVVGAVMGGIYGVLTEYRPEASAGFGTAYGVATSTLLDETGGPALDLDAPEEEASPSAQLYGAASHLVFGLVLEGVRWLIAGRR